MSRLFKRLPEFRRSAPGLEHAIWRRLPLVLFWGTAIPILLSVGHRVWSPASKVPASSAEDGLVLFDYTMIGLVSFHWTLVATVAIGCFIVRVMKGPAYVADAYRLPHEDRGPNP